MPRGGLGWSTITLLDPNPRQGRFGLTDGRENYLQQLVIIIDEGAIGIPYSYWPRRWLALFRDLPAAAAQTSASSDDDHRWQSDDRDDPSGKNGEHHHHRIKCHQSVFIYIFRLRQQAVAPRFTPFRSNLFSKQNKSFLLPHLLHSKQYDKLLPNPEPIPLPTPSNETCHLLHLVHMFQQYAQQSTPPAVWNHCTGTNYQSDDQYATHIRLKEEEEERRMVQIITICPGLSLSRKRCMHHHPAKEKKIKLRFLLFIGFDMPDK
ncbi:hypothetical protein Fcan01_13342 [Folsomia candida]|uniref:Uncharacterized protein n=1 Tax=Folsomia candida TaxID=158441 RepID=A0A226E3I8_FOLCA|nr:hypothetical protein Fcan01_13342 [Folsomia candida]